ncbi:unnamed protein product [Rhizoctonia solani]|uniref:Uncharacterized protein n=1 Tax=Rhizoctonia solani TaxID=456999 RepID=A0A8H2XAF1_9AGAM|nr:unnamed protein product [Rhizoctonia solani]
MKLFANFFKSQHNFKGFHKGIPSSEIQDLPVVDFILVDLEEEEETTCTDTSFSKDCSPFYTESQTPNIPSTLRSDMPLPVICPSGNFLDLRGTYPSLPLPMGVFNGAEICINASFKGYLATLLVPCIWLVLGSYVFVAAMAYIFHTSKKLDVAFESSVNDGGIQIVQGVPICDHFISEAPLPTPEDVLESTLKQYGHLSDFGKDDAASQSLQCLLPPNRKPNPTALDQKALKNTVLKDVDIMFRGTVPDSWIARESNSGETHSAFRARSVHTAAMDVIEVSTPIVRIPTRSPVVNSIAIQHSDAHNTILLRPTHVGAVIRPGTLLLATPKTRPAPITTDTRHLAPMQHQCFNSSPLKYSHTMVSHRPLKLRTQVSGSSTLPTSTLRKSTRVSSG